ncbi:MAG TPA: methyl-accepting chemotaxis protein [Longimicrobiales bacterium]|nr:methyl-accepting chemotaxis protein [Longimicrobiales bacterium]
MDGTLGFDQLFARERMLVMRARHAEAISRRWGFVLLLAGLAVLGGVFSIVHVSYQLAIALTAWAILVNVVVDWLWRAGRFSPWQFWLMVAVDTTLIGGLTAALGPHGYLALAAIVYVVTGYAMGLPEASQIQLALAGIAYPLGRVGGYLALDLPVPMELIGVETLFGMGMAWLTMRGVVDVAQRLRVTRRTIARIGGGDFTVRLPAERLDDIGFLSVSLNSMVDTLTETVREIQRQSAELTDMSEHLAGATHQIERAAQVFGSSTHTLAGEAETQMKLVDEGRRAVDVAARAGTRLRKEAANSAGEAKRLMDGAGDHAARIAQASELLEKVGQDFERASDAMGTLERAGESVGGFVSTIQEIARQTNLLALNAAIEAARAGEYGRGFAVVADEVHKLAHESEISAGDVSGTVDDIGKAIQDLRRRIAENNSRLSGVGHVAGANRESLTEVVSGLESTAGFVQEMAESLEEHAEAIGRIQQIMDRIQQIGRQSLEHSNSNATAAEGQLGELRRLVSSSQTLALSAERLAALAAQFRVPDELQDPPPTPAPPSGPSSAGSRAGREERAGRAPRVAAGPAAANVAAPEKPGTGAAPATTGPARNRS